MRTGLQDILQARQAKRLDKDLGMGCHSEVYFYPTGTSIFLHNKLEVNYMKKHAIILFCLLLIVTIFMGCSAKRQKMQVMTEAVTYGSNGTIVKTQILNNGSSAKMRHYTVFDGLGSIIGYIDEEYDDNGNKIASKEYAADKTTKNREQWTYGAENKLLSCKRFIGENVPDLSFEYLYDANGNEIECKVYNGNGTLKYHDENTYDSNGNLLSKISYDKEGDNTSRWDYSYDERNNLIKEKVTISNSSWFYEYWNQYDSAGKLIMQEKYDDDHDVVEQTRYIYSDNSNAYETKTYLADGTISDYHAYDENGQEMMWITYNNDGTIYHQSSWVNTAKGRMETVYRTPNFWWEHVYDANGNTIQYIEKDAETGSVITRTEYKYVEMR